jgi:hypothetical protein
MKQLHEILRRPTGGVTPIDRSSSLMTGFAKLFIISAVDVKIERFLSIGKQTSGTDFSGTNSTLLRLLELLELLVTSLWGWSL